MRSISEIVLMRNPVRYITKVIWTAGKMIFGVNPDLNIITTVTKHSNSKYLRGSPLSDDLK